MKNHSDALVLNLTYQNGQDQEIEDAYVFQKLSKIGFATFITLSISILFGVPSYYDTRNDSPSTKFLFTGITASYGTTTAWFCLQLEKEFISNHYIDQRLSREARNLKIMSV